MSDQWTKGFKAATKLANKEIEKLEAWKTEHIAAYLRLEAQLESRTSERNGLLRQSSEFDEPMIKSLAKENLELEAQLATVRNEHIQIRVKPDGVWIHFKGYRGRKALLNLNTIVNNLNPSGMTQNICVEAIKAAITEEK